MCRRNVSPSKSSGLPSVDIFTKIRRKMPLLHGFRGIIKYKFAKNTQMCISSIRSALNQNKYLEKMPKLFKTDRSIAVKNMTKFTLGRRVDPRTTVSNQKSSQKSKFSCFGKSIVNISDEITVTKQSWNIYHANKLHLRRPIFIASKLTCIQLPPISHLVAFRHKAFVLEIKVRFEILLHSDVCPNAIWSNSNDEIFACCVNCLTECSK